MLQQISQVEYEHLALWYLLQHSVSSYEKLIQYFEQPSKAIEPQAYSVWEKLKLHQNHLKRFKDFQTSQGKKDFEQVLEKVKQSSDHLVIRGFAHYPETLTHYADSPPILFLQGNLDLIAQSQIAMVGSRTLSPHGAQVAYDFAQYFAEKGYVVTSGLAIGIDAASHHGAMHTGKTIAVIATGLDQCYPTEHMSLVEKIKAHQGTILSEFFPETPPRKQYFPRRNRIISALSQATLIVEAGLQSGSLITAKYAAEQGKSVFAIPGHIYSQYHQGCHHLIREGATLVDHPAQVIEDLSTFVAPAVIVKTHQTKTVPLMVDEVVPPPHIPEHLLPIYLHLDWIGISIDQLALDLQLSISDLTVALVELELLGLCKQHAGRYLRC